jgi:organic hydroperoxide reductase OsmC/OhrA
MARVHAYEVSVHWSGLLGPGDGHSRDHEVTAAGPPPIAGSSDPAFRGDPGRWNPEQLLVASLSQCHMLWYLHLCSRGAVAVTDYLDRPRGVMHEDGAGGRFVEVVLRPEVVLATADRLDLAMGLHEQAHRSCFIGNSVAFPVRVEPSLRVAGEPDNLLIG